jgi:hypothetical protein
MSRLAIGLLAIGLLAALGAAASPSHFASERHAVITIDKDGLHPRVLTVGTDEVVGWLNYTDATAQVVFPDDVSDAFTCSSERPSFYRIAGGRLASRSVGALEFLLPCRLDPGIYRYGVVLSYGTGGILEGLASSEHELPEFDLKGEIRVE